MEQGFCKKITEELFKMQDLSYRDFHASLMPGTDKNRIIGVRMPSLRTYAKKLFLQGDYEEFLSSLPHDYYEEMNLHSLIICQIKDYDEVIARLDAFLPYIDNWATCDITSPKIFKNNTKKLYPKICEWLTSSHTYTVRFGVGMLMTFYLEDAFFPETMEKVAALRSEEYYVNMMIAWYFATALFKKPDCAVKYIEERRLSPFTHNKAIQKAIESRRISPEQKEYLRSLKIK